MITLYKGEIIIKAGGVRSLDKGLKVYIKIADRPKRNRKYICVLSVLRVLDWGTTILFGVMRTRLNAIPEALNAG